MAQGPEDSIEWKTQADKATDSPPVIECRKCKEKITEWHCTNAGCPWCKDCGDANRMAAQGVG